VHIEQLSRLVTGSRANAARDGLTDGSVNIVIGTQALL
jgi:transcription-repair coupling factor (superfamily II helicase)